MSVEICTCTNCGRSGLPGGSAFARIELYSSKHCDACKHSHELRDSAFFCSMKCLVEFAQKHPERLLRFEQDTLNEVRKWSSDYVNPLFDDPITQRQSNWSEVT